MHGKLPSDIVDIELEYFTIDNVQWYKGVLDSFRPINLGMVVQFTEDMERQFLLHDAE